MGKRIHPKSDQRAIIAVKLYDGLYAAGIKLHGYPKYSTKRQCFSWLCELPNGHVCLCGFKLYPKSFGRWRIAADKYSTTYHRLGHIFNSNALEQTGFRELTLATAELTDKNFWFQIGQVFGELLTGQSASVEGLGLSTEYNSFPGNSWTELAFNQSQIRQSTGGAR